MRRKVQKNKNKQEQKYTSVIVKIYPDPNSYNLNTGLKGDLTRTTDDVLFTEILNRYQGAWEKLAKM